MAEPQVVIEGLNELRAALRQLGDRDLQKMLPSAQRKAAEVVVHRAQPKVPVRTGRLKASLRASGTLKGGSALAGGGRVKWGTTTHWGRKRGNVGSPPGNRKGENVVQGRPFLYEALHESEGEIVDVFTHEVQQVLDRLHWTTTRAG